MSIYDEEIAKRNLLAEEAARDPLWAAQKIIDLQTENGRLRAEVKGNLEGMERLRADRDNWELVCSGALKEQFRIEAEKECLRGECGALRHERDLARAALEGRIEVATNLQMRNAELEAENKKLRAQNAALMEALIDADNAKEEGK